MRLGMYVPAGDRVVGQGLVIFPSWLLYWACWFPDPSFLDTDWMEFDNCGECGLGHLLQAQQLL